jgi:hypothetical protein
MQLEGQLLTLPDYAIANKGFIEAGVAMGVCFWHILYIPPKCMPRFQLFMKAALPAIIGGSWLCR